MAKLPHTLRTTDSIGASMRHETYLFEPSWITWHQQYTHYVLIRCHGRRVNSMWDAVVNYDVGSASFMEGIL